MFNGIIVNCLYNYMNEKMKFINSIKWCADGTLDNEMRNCKVQAVMK